MKKGQVFFKARELAERWSVSLNTIKNMRAKGVIPAFKLPGSNRYVFPVREILAYEEEHTRN